MHEAIGEIKRDYLEGRIKKIKLMCQIRERLGVTRSMAYDLMDGMLERGKNAEN